MCMKVQVKFTVCLFNWNGPFSWFQDSVCWMIQDSLFSRSLWSLVTFLLGECTLALQSEHSNKQNCHSDQNQDRNLLCKVRCLLAHSNRHMTANQTQVVMVGNGWKHKYKKEPSLNVTNSKNWSVTPHFSASFYLCCHSLLCNFNLLVSLCVPCSLRPWSPTIPTMHCPTKAHSPRQHAESSEL